MHVGHPEIDGTTMSLHCTRQVLHRNDRRIENAVENSLQIALPFRTAPCSVVQFNAIAKSLGESVGGRFSEVLDQYTIARSNHLPRGDILRIDR